MENIQKIVGTSFSLPAGCSYTASAVERALLNILTDSCLISIATYDTNFPHTFTAYYAVSPDLRDLWFLSEVSTEHSRQIAVDGRVAGSVFLPNSGWGAPIAGLQLRGKCEIESEYYGPGGRAYFDRFPQAAESIGGGFTGDYALSRFHRIGIESLKLVNMPVFGEEEYVLLTRVVR